MNRVCLYLLAGALLLVGCNSQNKGSQNEEIQKNVNPDQIFGRHYTAADFGLWPLLEYEDAQYVSLVSEAMKRLPEENSIELVNQYGVILNAADTAAFMQALRESEILNSFGDTLFTPCWFYIPDMRDDAYELNFYYGDKDGNPIIDGRQVKKVSVVKNSYMGGVEVSLQFDMKTADFWQKYTADNIGKRIGMMLGSDRVLSTPHIMCEIAGGACSISGPTEDECCAIAAILKGDK